jgi:hypothetical protein
MTRCRSTMGLLVASVVSTVACSGGSAPSDDRAALEQELDPVAGMEVETGQQPITTEDELVIRSAESRLIASCMAGQGFDYEARAADEIPNDPPILSPAELRNSGYQYDWTMAAERYLELNGPEGPPDPTEGMTPEERAEYEDALASPHETVDVQLATGVATVPVEGCQPEAWDTLYGSVANALRFNQSEQQFDNPVAWMARHDDFSAAADRWRACMRLAGHDIDEGATYGLGYLLSLGASALQEEGIDQTTVTADLIQSVTLADADCQESSGLDQVREALMPEARGEVAADVGLEMNEYVAFQHAVLERAKQVP